MAAGRSLFAAAAVTMTMATIVGAVVMPPPPSIIREAISKPTPSTIPQLTTGWTCDSYAASGANCQESNTESYSRSISIDFGGGPTFDPKGIQGSAAGTIGISVSWTSATSEAASVSCPPPPKGSKDDAKCTCGLMSTAHVFKQDFQYGESVNSHPVSKWTKQTVTFPEIKGDTSSGVPGTDAVVEWSVCQAGGTCPQIPKCPS